MTKKIRIENADNSNYKVRVHVERRDSDGNWTRTDTRSLDLPCDLAELWVYGGQRLVVEEIE